MSDELEGRVTEEMSQEFKTTASCILFGISELDEFLLKSQVVVESGTALEKSRRYDMGNQESHEDRSQAVSQLEVCTSINRSSQSEKSDADEVS